MTRKHFQLIADHFNYTRPIEEKKENGKLPTNWEVIHQWEKDVFAIANALQASNPRFDRERFIKACKGA